jgi:hypothetical protein
MIRLAVISRLGDNVRIKIREEREMANKSRLVRFMLDEHTEAVFETDLASDGKEELVSRGGEDEIPLAKDRLDVLTDRIRPVANTLFDALKELNTPQEINLEFGIKLGGKTGIVFASAETECNFKIGLKWTNPKPTA